jgi:type II secretion system protein L
MRHWLAMLAENNINIDYLVPESALVRAANSGMTLWLEPERALMATDDNVVELDAIILEEYCRGLVDEEQTELISFIDPASLPEFLETDKFLKSQHPDTDFKLKIATAFDAFNTINLLQCEYKKPSLLLEKTKPWHPSAGLVLVMLVLLWVFLAVDNSKIKAQVASLNNQINQVYSSAFPGSRLVNSKLQMQDKLKNLAVKGNKQKDVSTLVSELGAVVQRASKLSLNELDFRGSLLRLSLAAKELDPLEELADKLKADGYNATLKSVRLVAGEVSANIEVRVR